MNDILIDTSAWINFFTQKEKSQSELITVLLSKGGVAINGFIMAELLQGVRKEEERRVLEKRLSSLRQLPIRDEEFRKAGHLSAVLRQKGKTVSLVDILIAQSAMSHDLPLLHWDSDFNRIAQHSSLEIHPTSLK